MIIIKSIEKLFTTDIDQKELIAKISALCGLKQDIIKHVWMYTFFSTYLSLLEQRDKSMFEIKVPYLGKIMIKFNEDNKDFEQFLLLDSNVKDIVKNMKAGNDSGLVEYFKEKFVNKIVESLEE